jgi:ion channel
VRLLRELGYTSVRHLEGGIAEWRAAGEPIEGQPDVVHVSSMRPIAARPHARGRIVATIDRIGELSIRSLLAIWLAMATGCGLFYWAVSALMRDGLMAAGEHIGADAHGLLTALYFSFVTATSVGYGDVVPLGPIRLIAIGEAMAGLLLFGVLISKFVSRRQELLIEQIHQTTFEERLGRLRTNLHLVLSELQGLSELCSGQPPSTRVMARVESAGAVFVGELQSIHDLLYRPQDIPEEQVLEAMLASLAACLDEFHTLLGCLPPTTRSAAVRAAVSAMTRLANDICGECVPREYAPELKSWMDNVQRASRDLASA